MGLRFIYGRSGCGKSNFCYNQIKNEIDKEEKIYMITPEQFSFTAEKTLLEVLEKKSVIKVEVITFKRMAERIFLEVYGAANTVLSDSGKSMLLYDVLSKNKKKLKFLSNPNDVEIIQSTITDLKKHKVDEDSLKNVIEKTESEYLKTKLNDLNLILEQYNKKIEDNFIDEDDILTILAKILNKSEMFKNSIIYIDEFAGFTKQEYEIIKILLKQAKTVNVTISTDSLASSISPDADIFYSNKLTIDKLFLCAKETNSSIEEPIFLDKLYRFKNNELIHLEQNLYKVPYKTYNEKVKNIQLFLAKNPYSEIENVAKSILKIIREKNIRYRDISVLTKNVEEYSSTIKMIFEKYEIPVFIDEKKELSQNILIKYILAVLEIFADNWSFNSMFNYLKIGFVDVEKQDLYKLENYCNKYGIKGRKWLEEWKYIDDELDKLNGLRQDIIKPLLNLKEKIDSDKKVINITKNLYEFLELNEIFKKLEERIEYFNIIGKLDIANQYATSINVLVQVLDELVLIFGNEELGFSKYREILKVGLSSSSLGVIPPSCDQVTVGDVDRSRSHRVNTLFIIGLNDGIFPSVNKSEGFLNDKDREVLKQNDLEIAKGTLEKLYEDQFSIYKAFTTAEENLYLSYSSTNKEGKTLRPSLLMTRIKKIFKNIKETSDTVEKIHEIISSSSTFEELLNKIRDFENGEQIDKKWIDVYNWYKNNDEWKEKLEKLEKDLKNDNTPEIIKKENIQKLYGDTLKTSVSRLEQYKKCPFSFYLKYGLKLEEQAQYKLQAIDTGSFMHDVIDEFFEWINYNNIEIKKVNIQKDDITLETNGEEESLKKVINIIIEKKLKLQKNYIFTSSKKFISLTNKLKKVIFQSIQYILYQLKISDFKILGNEIEFENGAKYPPIEIQLDNGKKVEVTGKIDRVDIAKNDQGEFIRIIDYKSSARSVDLNEVVAGLQIQLLTYMDAITKIEDVLPAGILYFNLMDPIIKNNKNLEDEEIEEEIKKKFKMQGLLLADVKVIKMMDKNLNKGYSNTLPIYIDKDGNLSNSRSNVISKEKFEKLQEYIKKIIKDISKEILKGNIELKPFYKMKDKQTPCEYCSYKSICKFNAKKNCYNYIGNLKKEEVLENI